MERDQHVVDARAPELGARSCYGAPQLNTASERFEYACLVLMLLALEAKP